MPNIKLYYSPAACSLSPHIALIESGLPYEIIRADMKTKRTEDGQDYLTISPKGKVPAIVTADGQLVTEGAAIVQYIADQAPKSGLAPANGTFERTKLQEWLNFIATEIHKGFSPLWNAATPEAYKTIVLENLNKNFKVLESHFAANKFLLGDNFSVADGYAFTCLNWTTPLKVSLEAYPKLKEFMARVSQRPSVQKALKEEGLLDKAA